MNKIDSAKDAYEFAKQFALEEDKRQRLIVIYTKDDGTVGGWQERADNQAMLKISPSSDVKWAIIVTNHPSGNSLPNKYDIQETMKMKELLRAKGIGLTDQLIVGYKEFYSYAEEKIIFVNK